MNLASLLRAARGWVPVQAEWSPDRSDGFHFTWPAPAADDARRAIVTELLAALRQEAGDYGIAVLGAVVETGRLRRYDRGRPLAILIRVASSASAEHVELLCRAAARRAPSLAVLAERDALEFGHVHVGDETRMLMPPMA